MQRGRPVIRRDPVRDRLERGRLWLAGQIRDSGASLHRGANDHAFVAAQIDDAFHLLAVPASRNVDSRISLLKPIALDVTNESAPRFSAMTTVPPSPRRR